MNQEYLTFLILSKNEEQLLWCVRNIRYKNSSKILVCHDENNEVVNEICNRYKCHMATSLHDAKERFKINPTRYLIVINDTTRISQLEYIPEHDIVGDINKGCLIAVRSVVEGLELDTVGEKWHCIKDVSKREWWNYPKDDYPILSPCMLEDAKCKFSPT